MPILTLKYEDKPVKEYRIDKGGTLTIGRRDTNDIVVENLGVSGTHAKIDSVDDRYLLTDLQSRNGTFVNDRLVTSHWLSNGDVVTVGKHLLVFGYGEGETVPEGESALMEQTMVMETEKYQDLLSKNFGEQAGSASEIERDTIGALTFLAGGEGEIRLTKKLNKIGKDSSCEVVVSGLMVGKIAATISSRPGGYYLSYVGGLAKPKVNGVTVKESVKLEEFDTIELGSAKVQFLYQFVYKK